MKCTAIISCTVEMHSVKIAKGLEQDSINEIQFTAGISICCKTEKSGRLSSLIKEITRHTSVP